MTTTQEAVNRIGYRRLILDMHIGDWDPGFLAKIDPRAIAEACLEARLSAFMLYAISHVGLCNWPTRHGRMHAGLKGRDLVGELLGELQRRDIAVCGYISVIFDNWAFLEHPDWRIQPAKRNVTSSDALFAGSRYGLVCPNHPEYRAYIRAQIEDLYRHYAFDYAFFDMLFWPDICRCPHCVTRYRHEEGREFPETVNWLDAGWCRFAAARARWLAEFTQMLSDTVKAIRSAIPVFHNLACLHKGWERGASLAGAAANDFLGADFYGDAAEQLLVCKLFAGLSRHPPIEFMTTRCPTPGSHELVKSAAEMRRQVQSATLASAAFMWIDAINPDGTINPAIYRRIGEVFAATQPYEAYLGGESVAEVAIYFSDDSKMDFRENGTAILDARGPGDLYPHMKSARGLAGVLQRAQVPFDVITARDLPRLERYRLVLLPNVLRMSPAEASAFRDYVAGGGHLYASRYSAWTGTDGSRGSDFQLADVFGCHVAGDDLGTVTYLRPQQDCLAAAITPQAYLDHFGRPGTEVAGVGTLRLAAGTEGTVLATLTVPYATEWGDLFNRRWASIHSSPPWRDTATPAIVEHAFGKGRAIYSAADIECVRSSANDALLRHLLFDRLLPGTPVFSAEAHPCVWSSVFHQPEHRRLRVCFLNRQEQEPALPVDGIRFTLRPPPGCRFTSLTRIPDGAALPFTTDLGGGLCAAPGRLEELLMLAARYEPAGQASGAGVAR